MSISDILRKAGGMQSPYTAYSPVSWYNREESHSGQLYHLYKAVLSLCPEYDTSLMDYITNYPACYLNSKQTVKFPKIWKLFFIYILNYLLRLGKIALLIKV